jgi:putative tryptophan/tyrosine transport system substrate-binding protein
MPRGEPWGRPMRRREFITLLGGAVALRPLSARAQQSGRLRQVGVLYPGPKSVAALRIKSILSGLEAGGLPSDKLTIVARVAEGDPALLQPMAVELVEQKVDLIAALGPASLRAARAATTSIPIVAGDLESNPLSTGFIAEIRRPGGNVTGVYLDSPDFSKKWLQALKEVIPQNSLVAVLWDSGTGRDQRNAVESAAAELNLTLTVLEVSRANDLEPAMQTAKNQGAGGLIALSSPLVAGNTKLLADLALKHHLPAITLFAEFARDGGLMSYGPSIQAVVRQEGVMAARILLGANPAEMPIETPTRFEFVLNLITAKALGIAIPAPTLLRADEVIE